MLPEYEEDSAFFLVKKTRGSVWIYSKGIMHNEESVQYSDVFWSSNTAGLKKVTVSRCMSGHGPSVIPASNPLVGSLIQLVSFHHSWCFARFMAWHRAFHLRYAKINSLEYAYPHCCCQDRSGRTFSWCSKSQSYGCIHQGTWYDTKPNNSPIIFGKSPKIYHSWWYYYTILYIFIRSFMDAFGIFITVQVMNMCKEICPRRLKVGKTAWTGYMSKNMNPGVGNEHFWLPETVYRDSWLTPLLMSFVFFS